MPNNKNLRFRNAVQPLYMRRHKRRRHDMRAYFGKRRAYAAQIRKLIPRVAFLKKVLRCCTCHEILPCPRLRNTVLRNERGGKRHKTGQVMVGDAGENAGFSGGVYGGGS